MGKQKAFVHCLWSQHQYQCWSNRKTGGSFWYFEIISYVVCVCLCVSVSLRCQTITGSRVTLKLCTKNTLTQQSTGSVQLFYSNRSVARSLCEWERRFDVSIHDALNAFHTTCTELWKSLGFPMCAKYTDILMPCRCRCRCRSAKRVKTEANIQYLIVVHTYARAYTRCCTSSIHRECKVVMRKKQRIFLHQCVEQFLFSRISSVLQFWRFSGIWFFTFSTIASNTFECYPKHLRTENIRLWLWNGTAYSSISINISSTRHRAYIVQQSIESYTIRRRFFRLTTPTILDSVLPFSINIAFSGNTRISASSHFHSRARSLSLDSPARCIEHERSNKIEWNGFFYRKKNKK